MSKIDHAAAIRNARERIERNDYFPCQECGENIEEVDAALIAIIAERDRWKRMAMADAAYEDALLLSRDDNEQQRVREELRAAHADLKAHGDLDEVPT